MDFYANLLHVTDENKISSTRILGFSGFDIVADYILSMSRVDMGANENLADFWLCGEVTSASAMLVRRSGRIRKWKGRLCNCGASLAESQKSGRKDGMTIEMVMERDIRIWNHQNDTTHENPTYVPTRLRP